MAQNKENEKKEKRHGNFCDMWEDCIAFNPDVEACRTRDGCQLSSCPRPAKFREIQEWKKKHGIRE